MNLRTFSFLFLLLNAGCQPESTRQPAEPVLEKNTPILVPAPTTINDQKNVIQYPSTPQKFEAPKVVLPPTPPSPSNLSGSYSIPTAKRRCPSFRNMLPTNECGFVYSTPYNKKFKSRLTCRLNYQYPHLLQNSEKVAKQTLKFYTNCASCSEAALKEFNGRTSSEAPVTIISGKRCDRKKILWDVQYSIRYSFWVETLPESTCVDDTVYFAFPSAFAGSLMKNGERDACSI